MPDLRSLNVADFQPNIISATVNNAFCNQCISDLESWQEALNLDIHRLRVFSWKEGQDKFSPCSIN